jgi:hypothetical protein
MASQQKTSTTTSSTAFETPIDAQERIEAWLYRTYVAELAVRRTLPLSQADFHQRYFQREVLPSAPEAVDVSGPVESELSSEGAGALPALAAMLRSAMNFLLPRSARYVHRAGESASNDTSSSDATTFSWGCRSLKQPRSLPVLSPAQPEAGEIAEDREIASGYEADISCSSESDRPAWASAPSASGDEASDLDSEAQFIVTRVDNLTRDHGERMSELGLYLESSGGVEPASSPITPEPMPAPLDAQVVTEILAQVGRDFALANQMVYDYARMSYSRGEYRAEIARIEALNRERLAVVDREYRRLRGIWSQQVTHSRGEWRAQMAEIEAMNRVHTEARAPFSSTQ